MLVAAVAFNAERAIAELSGIRYRTINVERLLEMFMEEGQSIFEGERAPTVIQHQLNNYIAFRQSSLHKTREELLKAEYGGQADANATHKAEQSAATCSVFSNMSVAETCDYAALFKDVQYPKAYYLDEAIVHFANQSTVISPAQEEYDGWSVERWIFQGSYRIFAARGADSVTRSFINTLVLTLAPNARLEVLVVSDTITYAFNGFVSQYEPRQIDYQNAEFQQCADENTLADTLNLGVLHKALKGFENGFVNLAVAGAFACGGASTSEQLLLINTQHANIKSCIDSRKDSAPANAFLSARASSNKQRSRAIACAAQLSKSNLHYIKLFQNYSQNSDLIRYFRQQIVAALGHYVKNHTVITQFTRSSRNLDEALVNYVLLPFFVQGRYGGVIAQSLNIDQLVQTQVSPNQELISGDLFLINEDRVFYVSNQKVRQFSHTRAFEKTEKHETIKQDLESKTMEHFEKQIFVMHTNEVFINDVSLQQIYRNMSSYEDNSINIPARDILVESMDTKLKCLKRARQQKLSTKMLSSQMLDTNSDISDVRGMMLILALSDSQFLDKNFSLPIVYFHTTHQSFEQYFDCEEFKKTTGLPRCLDDYMDKLSLKLPIQLLTVRIEGIPAASENMLPKLNKLINLTISDIVGTNETIQRWVDIDEHNVSVVFSSHLVYQIKQLALLLVLGYNNIDVQAVKDLSVEIDAYKHCIMMTSIGTQMCIARPEISYYNLFATSLGLRFSTTYSIVNSQSTKFDSCPREQTLNTLYLTTNNVAAYLSGLLANGFLAHSVAYREEALIVLVPVSKRHRTFTYQIISNYGLAKYDYYHSKAPSADNSKALLNAYAFLIFHPKLLSIVRQQNVNPAFFFDVQICQQLYFSLPLAKALFAAGALEMTVFQYSGQFCVSFEFVADMSSIQFSYETNPCTVERITGAQIYEITCEQPLLNIEESQYPCFHSKDQIDSFTSAFHAAQDQCAFAAQETTPETTSAAGKLHEEHVSLNILVSSLLFFAAVALCAGYLLFMFPKYY